MVSPNPCFLNAEPVLCPSLVPQRLNRIKICSLPRRINPEHQSNQTGHTKPYHRPHARHARRQRAHQQPYQQGHDSASQNADHAANHQAYAGNRDHKDRETSGKLVPQARQRVRRKNLKVVRLLHVHLAAATQQLANLIFHQCAVALVIKLHAHPHATVHRIFRMQLHKRTNGEECGIVFLIAAAAKDLLLFLENADDGKDAAFNLYFFSNRALIPKKCLCRVIAQNDHIGAAVRLILRPHAPFPEAQVGNLCYRRAVALQHHALGLFVAVLHANHARLKHRVHVAHPAIGCHHMRELTDRRHIIKGQLFARQHLCRGAHSNHGHVEDPQDIGPQGVHPLLHVVVQAVDDRRNRDHRRHANHNAEDRQPGAQFIGTQRLNRHAHCFTRIRYPHSSDLNATMGSSIAALRAGYTPKKMPTPPDTNSASSTDHTCMSDGKPMASVTSLATPAPHSTPIAPPTSDIVADSIRNCSRISVYRAPSAFRTPISRVRSVTLTSMMFIMTIPPTISEMEAIPITTKKNVWLMLVHSPTNVAFVSREKLSSAPGASCLRERRIARASSEARSSAGPTSPAFT